MPDGTSEGSWRSFSSFPLELSDRLQTKFDTEHATKKIQVKNHSSMIRSQERYHSIGCCVGSKALPNSARTMKWDYAQGDKNRSCDLCTRAGRLCARLVKAGEAFETAVFPLSDRIRYTAKWDEQEF